MIQTIIFATDLCAFTPYLVEHVIALATRCNARIIVVHAVEPMGSLATAMVQTYFPGDIVKELTEEGSDVILSSIKSQLIDILADEFVENDEQFNQYVEVIVEAGKPADVILKYINDKNADLVIVGSHSPESLTNYNVGSVTNKILQMTKVPVYMVPLTSQCLDLQAKINAPVKPKLL
ncbi:universal stress protein [Aurantivibrio infirmus]